MKFCPYCGAGLDEDMLFCPKCGKRFSSEKPNPNYVGSPTSVENCVSDNDDIKSKAVSEPSSNKPPEKKSPKSRLVIIVICFVALVAFSGYYLKKYSDAKTHAAEGLILVAKDDLFFPNITRLHDPQLCDYIDAFEMLSSGDVQGFSVISNLAKNNYSYAVTNYSEAERLLYDHAVRQYKDGKYGKAKELFAEIKSFDRSSDYLALIEGHSHSELATSSDDIIFKVGLEVDKYKRVLKLIGFEDGSAVLINNFYQHYLHGNWKTSDGKYYFSMDDDFKIKYNIPSISSSGSYYFSDGIYKLKNGTIKTSDGFDVVVPESESSDNPLRNVFRFSPIDEDTLTIYSFSSEKNYTLFRQ